MILKSAHWTCAWLAMDGLSHDSPASRHIEPIATNFAAMSWYVGAQDDSQTITACQSWVLVRLRWWSEPCFKMQLSPTLSLYVWTLRCF